MFLFQSTASFWDSVKDTWNNAKDQVGGVANDALNSFYAETGVSDFNGFLQKVGIDEDTIGKMSSYFTDPNQIQDLIGQMNLDEPEKLLQYLKDQTDLDQDTIDSFMKEVGLESDDISSGSGCSTIFLKISSKFISEDFQF